MARKSTIKLLLINESDNEGERLISVFRNAGRVARTQRASSLEDLHNLLEKEQWDLLIASDKHPEISIEQALDQLNKSNVNIPALILTDGDAIPILEAGASDVIAQDDDQRLVLTAFRELQHLDNFRELSDVKAKLVDAEERSNLLMAQSQDAIAYVADGMLVSSNELFASRFGYENPDDLDCAPIIDLIDSADQGKFKGLLKSQLSNGEGNTDFSFSGLKQSGENFAAAMQLSNAVFDDEPCIQLSIRDQGAASSTSNGNADKDYLTDLYSQPYLLGQLDSATKQAAAGTGTSSLLFISIDKFSELRSRLGIGQSGNFIKQLAQQLQQQSEAGQCLARLGDDSFGLLLADTDSEKAKAFAESLCENIEQFSTELADQTVKCTISIGVATIDGQHAVSAGQFIDNGFASAEQVREASGGNGVAIFVPAREIKSMGDAANDADLDTILEEALEDGQFVLLFQPVVSLRGASGDHYEVLTRMIDGDGKELEANEFMQSLNFDEVNTRLDRWIILEASKLLAAQIDASHDTRLFINLTAHSLRDESLIAWLGVALKAGGIPAEAISFQFQEADILEHTASAKNFAQAIKDLGCKLSIAGFGLSNETIDGLDQVNADHVKIADKYTEELLGGGESDSLKTLVSKVKEQETQAIISGVENAAALAQLWQLGVDYIQGHYLAGPSRQMDYEFTDIA